MKPILSALSALWYNVGRVDLRAVLLVCGLVLSIFSVQSSLLSQIDFRLLQFSSLLFPTPRGTSDIAIITVPKDEMQRWQSDIHAAGRLGALLSNVLHASSSTIGILLNQPLNFSKLESETVVEAILASKSKLSSDEQGMAKELILRKQFLLDFLNDERVVLGTSTLDTNAAKISTQPGMLQPWPALLLRVLWPVNYRSGEIVPSITTADAAEHFPFHFNHHLPQQQLIFGNPQHAAYLTFFGKYFVAAQNLGSYQADQLVWQADAGLSYLSAFLPASPEATFTGLFGHSQRLQPAIETIPLIEALSRGAFPQYIFIAQQGSPQALQIATDFYSAINQRTAHQPWWMALVERILLLASTLYLCFILPRISAKTALIATAATCFVLICIQIIAVLSHQLLLLLSLNIAWLVVGHALIELWKQRNRLWQQLQTREETLTLQHADILLENAQYAKLAEMLSGAKTSPLVLQRQYDLANIYAEKRQYSDAIQILKSIAARHKRYKDTEQKIDALEAMIETHAKTQIDELKLTPQTARNLEASNIERPELGRYKVKEELGRGAMGVVYLGFDPRISRKVAIKTFHYKQFQPERVEELKSRFYREAEAAGRLNHPSIVSVYDVGEEDDLAFIAMDFVAGKSLSAFTSNANLLPVFEVYRIIYEVAQALEYAHKNQIVHRDIKPGNIMYSPSPFQVKVTDFGIARLVDDSRTTTGEILGSPLYMSPEQLKGKKVNGVSDIFSLGVTFYQLLTGALPFLGDNLAALTYEIIHGKHKGVRAVRKDLPMSASRIINQCLQKSPEDRYLSAGDLALAVKKAIRRDFAPLAKKAGYI